jgi:osmotically-inducible protein OsmY
MLVRCTTAVIRERPSDRHSLEPLDTCACAQSERAETGTVGVVSFSGDTTVNKLKINAIAIAAGLAFSAGATAQSMSKAEYKSGKDGIAAEYKSARAACASMSGSARDGNRGTIQRQICEAEANGKKKVAKAELEARYAPSDKNRDAVRVAKAKAGYSVAKEKCEQAGNVKQVCMKEAKAAETRAMKNEGPGEYVDDSVITAKVKAAVFEEPSLKSTEINVTTYKGIVQLHGFVRSHANIDEAVEVARKVKGVKSVKNDMIVK